jgi:Tol biopolymer transport system component
MDIEGNEKSHLGQGFYRVTEPGWSPDGRYITYAGIKNNGDKYNLFIEAVQ